MYGYHQHQAENRMFINPSLFNAPVNFKSRIKKKEMFIA